MTVRNNAEDDMLVCSDRGRNKKLSVEEILMIPLKSPLPCWVRNGTIETIKQGKQVRGLQIHESAEDYLEAILMLKEEKGYSRSVDIATKLGVTKPSVSVAMKQLRENGYITMDAENLLYLTEKGYAIASRIYERHRVLTQYLIKLGVDPETAKEDACKMEHDISEATFDAIKCQLT